MACGHTLDHTRRVPDCPCKDSDPSHPNIVEWRYIPGTCADCHHGPTLFQKNRASYESDHAMIMRCYIRAKELGDRENMAILERLAHERSVRLMRENSRTPNKG
ncbi:unnamed protein product [Clonostachys rosea f. rosea IK726]|jgi:hypothetical protein|uniref:Uncharacterized protein n=2 Tax=Bionectria ochroleuca TaxID=29856 RepID=A0A8H7NNX8_BIOOC|nr:unnamed protein product [Clonostachys rosea f. rosea IK726]